MSSLPAGSKCRWTWTPHFNPPPLFARQYSALCCDWHLLFACPCNFAAARALHCLSVTYQSVTYPFFHISFTHWPRVLFRFTIENPWRMILVRSFVDLSGPRSRSSFPRPNLQGKRHLVVSNIWATYYLIIRPSRQVPTTSLFQEATTVMTMTTPLTCPVLQMNQFMLMTMPWQFTGRACVARQATWDSGLHCMRKDVESSNLLTTPLAG